MAGVLDVFITEILCIMRRVFGLCPKTRCIFCGARKGLVENSHGHQGRGSLQGPTEVCFSFVARIICLCGLFS